MILRTGLAAVIVAVVLAPQAFTAGQAGPVVVGAPVLTRTELRPSFIQADVNVTAGGTPVTPTGVTCTVSFAGDKVYGTRRGEGRYVRGIARCVFGFNNARYRGKTLVGELTVLTGTVGSSGGGKITKRFSVRIGPGNALEKPVGATIDAATQAAPRASTAWRGTLRVVHVHTDVPPADNGFNRRLDFRLTLLPGATKTDSLGWSVPVAWSASSSDEYYSRELCTDASGRRIPRIVTELTTTSGRTGDPVAGYEARTTIRQKARVDIRWDSAHSQWVVHFNGTWALYYTERRTTDCGVTWTTRKFPNGGLGGYTIRVDGKPTDRTLRGRGKPSDVIESDEVTATWDFVLGPAG